MAHIDNQIKCLQRDIAVMKDKLFDLRLKRGLLRLTPTEVKIIKEAIGIQTIKGGKHGD